MRTPCRIMFAFVAVALIPAWAGTSARAADQYWTNDLSGGNFTNADNWMSGTVPGIPDFAYFTNNATPSSIYTVTFTTSQTNNGLRVVDDSVRFDMGGYYWWGTNTTLGNWITSSVPQRVVFSSSSDTNVTGGNVADFGASTTLGGPANTSQQDIIRGLVDLEITDELGYGVTLRWGSGTGRPVIPNSLTVSGTNAEFQLGAVNIATFDTMLLVTNQAKFYHRYQHGQATNYGTSQVVNATYLVTGDLFRLGASNQDRARMYVTDNGTLVIGVAAGAGKGLYVGGAGTAGAELVLDNSSGIVSNLLILGGGATGSGLGGRLYVQNGATLWTRTAIYGSGTRSNLIVLNNGTITLGSGATAGVLTNRDVMRAAGTIRGLGDSPALFYTGPAGSTTPNQLHVGTSVGTLTLSNVNLEIDAGSETFWELSDTGLDQIVMQTGSASLLGSNLFSLASGAATPGPYKYGLGTYDFITGTNLTWNPQYANLTNLLGGYGLVENLDYRFGFVDLGSYQALRLEFVPEPSTVLLLVSGGLVLWRVRRKRS